MKYINVFNFLSFFFLFLQYHEINSFDVNCEPSASWQFGVHSHIDLGDPLVSDRETHLNQHFSGISGCVSSAPYNNTVQPNHSQSILSSNTQGSLHQLRSHIGMTHHSHLLNLHDRSELSLCPEVSAMPANIGQCHQLLPLSPACLVTQHFNELSPDEMIQQPVVSEIEFIIDDDLLQGYNPELRETENPFYFHINQVLFNAHCMRMRRVATHIVPRSNS